MLSLLIYYAFGLYAFGLMAYVLLSWVKSPSTEKIRLELEKFYVPFLAPLRRNIKPVNFGGTALDLTPAILLIAIIVVRNLLMAIF